MSSVCCRLQTNNSVVKFYFRKHVIKVLLLNASYDICILVSEQTVNWVSFPSQRFSSQEDKKAATLSIKYTPNKTSSERKYRGKKTEFRWLGSEVGQKHQQMGIIERCEARVIETVEIILISVPSTKCICSPNQQQICVKGRR